MESERDSVFAALVASVDMGDQIKNLDDVSAFTLSLEERERLFEIQNECTVCWTNREGWPVAMPHSFVWDSGRFWVHTTTKRKRVQALRDRPESCVVVTSLGVESGGAMVTAKTRAVVHDGDRERVQWLLPLFLKRVGMAADDEAFRQQMQLLDTPARVVIEFEPVDVFTYDSSKLRQAVTASGFNNWAQQ